MDVGEVVNSSKSFSFILRTLVLLSCYFFLPKRGIVIYSDFSIKSHQSSLRIYSHRVDFNKICVFFHKAFEELDSAWNKIFSLGFTEFEIFSASALELSWIRAIDKISDR